MKKVERPSRSLCVIAAWRWQKEHWQLRTCSSAAALADVNRARMAPQ
jgi:hypothetical protein